ncbi:hypothetical protein L0B53_16385 [Vibrio sp. SS-MA-C1-2]|uniref:hypothetical protein n=1 Tax=Vibrio sp. SS-MA-C1-2 TaxID=2908646 RepID=UPI001F259BA8|nr:hypothetical protein [Vibrio sp. SS-MA-C1-2]UJF18571.1 hypothetical protein L0B53_16385 [Vibrio sp. SS-MA-C1-2]
MINPNPNYPRPPKSLSHQEVKESPPRRISRELFFTIVSAYLLSRIALYFIGLTGVEVFGTPDQANFINGELISVQHLFQTVCRFDCVWFQRIIEHGYDTHPQWLRHENGANWAFMPLYPLLASFVAKIVGDTALALIIVTNLFFIASLFVITLTLQQLKFTIKSIKFAIWFIVFSPYTVYSMSGYTEPMFITFVSALFLFCYQRQWLWVAVFGCLAAVTRNLGVMLVFPVLWIAISFYGINAFLQFSTQAIKIIAVLWVIPLGFFSYMLYLYYLTGDGLAFGHIQIAWGRELHGPIYWLSYGFERGGAKLYLALASIIGLSLNLYLVVKRFYAEAIFMFIALILPLSSGVNAMPRYIFGLYPAFLAIILLVEQRSKLTTPLLCIGSVISGFITIAFFTHQFFAV